MKLANILTTPARTALVAVGGLCFLVGATFLLTAGLLTPQSEKERCA